MQNRTGRFYRDLGGNIAAARRARAWTQDQLAAAIGVARTTVVAIERGGQMTPLHVLLEIAAVLGVEAWGLVPPGPTAGPVARPSAPLAPETSAWLARVGRKG